MMFTNVDVIHQDDVPTSKPLLAFKHNPKAGGGSIFILLSEMKTRNNTYLANFLKESTYCTSHPNVKTKKKSMEEDSLYCQKEICVNSAKCKYSFLDLAERNDALMYIKEFDTADPIIQQRAFVVSSIREPCDQFLSLWAYGSSGRGALHRNVDGYGIDAPYFDSPRDIDAFRHDWLGNREIKGMIARRHHQSFGNNRLEDTNADNKLDGYPVDCWVYVDDFDATMYSCLREYEIQGGHVDWTAPLLSELVKDLQKKYDRSRRLQKLDGNTAIDRSNYTKNDPLHNVQENHHSDCSKYFDEETAAFIRYGEEEFIYDYFGYESCCGGRKPINKLIAPPPTSSSLVYAEEVGELEEMDYSLHVAFLFLLLPSLFYLKRRAI
mmetsp:Transcript_14026/g.28643  ORF Transcript_14026/g.28643 Transcript_14026/m.28643 type:complete len:380 (+) Transcript_14026:119-1258(+)